MCIYMDQINSWKAKYRAGQEFRAFFGTENGTILFTLFRLTYILASYSYGSLRTVSFITTDVYS
jgi:hypothetical protein